MPKARASLAVNKLILLYIASRLPQGMAHDDIVLLNNDGAWMLYFELEQYLIELAGDGLLEPRGAAAERIYAITAEGLHVLGLLKTDIPLPIRSRIDSLLNERRDGILHDQEVTASYAQDSQFEFPVTLRVLENGKPIFELNLTAPSAALAERLCARFRSEAADIYSGVVARLTREDGEEPE